MVDCAVTTTPGGYQPEEIKESNPTAKSHYRRTFQEAVRNSLRIITCLTLIET